MPAVKPRRSTIPSEQRVFSLILALVVSPQGLTKRELLSSVYGYADRFRHGVVDTTLERQFERDKDQVRALGIPIETLDSPEESGNTQLTRYRISKASLQIPTQLRLTADELTLLRLASLAWAEGSLSPESRRAAMKLEALGAGVETRYFGVAPSFGITAPQAPALQRAIDERRTVEFDYQLADRTHPLRRRVAPLQLHRADGRWHLIAFDTERGLTRVFLLSRMVGQVRVLRTSVPEEYLALIPQTIDELHALRAAQPVTLRVRQGSAACARLLSRAEATPAPSAPDEHTANSADAQNDTIDLVVGTLDYAIFAEELVSYGSDVVVHEPPEMVSRVRELLRRVAAQHTQITEVPA